MTLFPQRPQAPTRPLTCNRCGTLWAVVDLTGGHLHPDDYLCPDCLEQRHAEIAAERLNVSVLP